MGTRYAIHGLVSPGAEITVRKDDGSTLATIYAVQSGGSADADSKITAGATGRVAFYVDSDTYPLIYRFSLLVELTGYDDITVSDVWSSFYAVHGDALGSATASVLDVCNEALVLIGAAEITALDGLSDRAIACERLYPSVRDAVLRAYPWNCAMTYATLEVDATAPDWGYDYRYALPSSPYCLRVLGMEYKNYRFKVVGRYLYTNDVSDDASIRYTARLTSPADWDPLLREAIIVRLAHVLAIPVREDKKLADFMWSLYEKVLREARGVDGQEGSADPLEANTFTDFRQ